MEVSDCGTVVERFRGDWTGSGVEEARQKHFSSVSWSQNLFVLSLDLVIKILCGSVVVKLEAENGTKCSFQRQLHGYCSSSRCCVGGLGRLSSDLPLQCYESDVV